MMLRQQKIECRNRMREVRAAACAKNPDAPLTVRDRFLQSINIPPQAIVAGYAAQGHEMDPWPLMNILHTRGHKLALPVVAGPEEPLGFYAYAPGDELVTRGALAIAEPSLQARRLEPDILIVPLLAFDKRRYRLGQGGGYYDRTIAMLRLTRNILAVGVAYDVQGLDEIPAGPLDARLDKIVTETRAL